MDNRNVMITSDETNLIRKIAGGLYKKYYAAVEKKVSLTLEELFHYGIIGLFEAKKTFDRSKQVPWLVFASYRVRGAMLDEIRKLPMVRLPLNQYKKIKVLEEAKLDLMKTNGAVSAEVIAAKLNWPLSQVHDTVHLAQTISPMSLFDSNLETNPVPGNNTRFKPTQAASENQYIRSELTELLKKCMNGLKSSDRFILASRVLEGIKLRELAQSLSCSAENIRLRQQKAEKQLKKCIEKNGWSIENCLEVIQ